jgi:acyl-CoA thioester hydrolase
VPDPAAAEQPSGEFRYRHLIEVRFRDTDAFGHVNNAVYLTYFEAARAGYYREVTGSVFDSEEGARRQSLIIARASVDYLAPAYFGDTLIVECGAAWVGRSSFALNYRITAGDGARLVAQGQTVQVMFDYEAGRPIRIPANLLERLATYEGRPIPPRPQGSTR